MFWHLLIAPFVAVLTGLYNTLPPWTITIGHGAGDGSTVDNTSIDHSFIHYSLMLLAPFDKFVPLHDGVLPLVALALAIFLGLAGFKFIKFILSLVPTINFASVFYALGFIVGQCYTIHHVRRAVGRHRWRVIKERIRSEQWAEDGSDF